MADDLSLILSFPPERPLSQSDYATAAIEYTQKLTQLPSSTWSKPHDDQILLDRLDPRVYSIAYTLALQESWKAAGTKEADAVALLPYSADYLSKFDPSQVKYVSKQWQEVFAYIADAYRALSIAEVELLANAILRLDPVSNTFTKTHLKYVRFCLETNRPQRALALLQRNIYSYTSSERDETADGHDADTSRSSGINPTDILEYYLLGAHVYISQSLWHRAQLFLEFDVNYPSPHGSTSSLQVEAYKRWVLVTLMLDGQVENYSWTQSGQVLKSLRAISKSYETLAESFRRRDWRKFQAEMDVGARIWQQDGNAGLVQAVSRALLRYCVQDLSKTFMTLPISRVALHLTSTNDEAARLLHDLISSGQLNARVDGSVSNPTLSFISTTKAALGDDAIRLQKERIDELVQSVKDSNNRLLLSKEYVEYSRKSKGQGAETDPADQMDLEWSQPNTTSMLRQLDEDGDEDIMA